MPSRATRPIDHRFNRVPLTFLQPDRFSAISSSIICPSMRARNESFTPEFFEHVPNSPGLILNQRGQQNDFGARFERQDLVDRFAEAFGG